MVKMRYLPRRGGVSRQRGIDVFHIYVLFLILGGIAMLVMAGVKSGHYLLFYYVFLLPILMIFRFFRDRSAFRARQGAAPSQAAPSGYGQPPGYGQPSGGQPQGPVQ